MMAVVLSYPIRPGEATWPGNPSVSYTPHESMAKGDAANTSMIHLFNHYGTHMDAPYHFVKEGLKIAQVPFDRFRFSCPLLVELPMEPAQVIGPEALMPFKEAIAQCDLLMLRTGMSRLRQTDPETYSARGPAVGSPCARWLMDTFPNLKGLALDFVSLASYAHGEDGAAAHRLMLGAEHDHYVLIIEDVNLAPLDAGTLSPVYSIPLLIEGIDSCPVTMWMT